MNCSYKKFISSLFIIASVFSCSAKTSSLIEVNDIEKEHFNINVYLPSKLYFKNISLTKELIGNKWLLKIKPSQGITTVSKNDVTQTHISQTDFITLITDLLIYIKDHDLGEVDRIQLDFNLVMPIWLNIVNLVKEEVKGKEGKVKIKNIDLSLSVKNYLDSSHEITSLCNKLISIQFKCENEPIGLNPIAFNRNNLGKSWKSLISKLDAGISPKMWFDISVVNP